MKILFVATEGESYAISLFSSLLKKNGHQVYLIFDPKLFDTNDISQLWLKRLFDIRRQNLNKIRQIQPDLIGFSVYTKDYLWAVDMARMIKEITGVPIIFGGIHCTLVPDEVIKADCIDIVCVGEGEYALLELAQSLQEEMVNYQIKNLWFKQNNGTVIKNGNRPLIMDLDALPFPDRDIFFVQKPIFSTGYVLSSGRGCPFCCTFCVSGSLNTFYREKGLGTYVRQRSVKGVIEELVWAKKRYNYKTINFSDDVFIINVQWLKEFSKEYREKINVPFFCTANPGNIKDEELVILKESGCHMIGFGLQSVSESTRLNVLHRTGKNSRIKAVADLCHCLGVHFSFDHIFNIPGENENEQVDALKFYHETKPDVINTFWLTYFPGTKIIDIALQKQAIDKETIERINRGEASTSLLIGVGGKYSFGRVHMFDTFAFLFSILPLMPAWLVKQILKKKWYRLKISVPFLIRILIKDIARLKKGRFKDVFFPIQLLLINIRDNLKIKLNDCLVRQSVFKIENKDRKFRGHNT
jgi:radical SAM superfamily enzyme YgiQ (UPF0313 family)